MDVFDHRGKRLDEPEDEGPSHCPDCGLYYSEVNADGWILWDEDPETGYDRYQKVNPVTGCMCSPEDFEEPSEEEITARLREYDEAMAAWYRDEIARECAEEDKGTSL